MVETPRTVAMVRERSSARSSSVGAIVSPSA